MKQIFIILIGLLSLGGCEKYDIIDTGKAKGVYEGSMWEYFHTNHYDWDSVVVAIEHAGVRDIFEGTNPDYPEITFFGMTNWSVKHFIMHTLDDNGNQQYSCIRDIPAEECRRMILSHVAKGKQMKDSFDFEIRNTLEGGTEVVSLVGHKLRVYRIRTDFGSLLGQGAVGLGVHGLESGQVAAVASSDIQTDNGVVHSLSYEYEWTEL